jgi:hypothetical protein
MTERPKHQVLNSHKMTNLMVPLVSEPFNSTMCLAPGDLTNMVNVTTRNKARTDSLTECPA